jgi:hypothetical protein
MNNHVNKAHSVCTKITDSNLMQLDMKGDKHTPIRLLNIQMVKQKKKPIVEQR